MPIFALHNRVNVESNACTYRISAQHLLSVQVPTESRYQRIGARAPCRTTTTSGAIILVTIVISHWSSRIKSVVSYSRQQNEDGTPALGLSTPAVHAAQRHKSRNKVSHRACSCAGVARTEALLVSGACSPSRFFNLAISLMPVPASHSCCSFEQPSASKSPHVRTNNEESSEPRKLLFLKALIAVARQRRQVHG